MCKVIEHADGRRTNVFTDGTEMDVVWHGGMGDLMPGYNSRSQWDLFLEHVKFALPHVRFPKSNEDRYDELPEGSRPQLAEPE